MPPVETTAPAATPAPKQAASAATPKDTEAPKPAVTAADVPSFIHEGVAPAKSEQSPAESTSAAEPGTETPVTEATQPPESKRSQRSFDRRIDKLTKRAAELEARAEKAERILQQVQQPAAPVPGKPDRATFTNAEGLVDVDGYAKAVAEFEKQNYVSTTQREHQERQTKAFRETAVKAWDEKLSKADDKYPDWDEVVPELTPDNYAAVAIMTAENGEDVAYHVFKDQAELKRIAALDPIGQIREIGKISAKLLAQPAPAKEPPKLPAPIAPVNGSGTPSALPSDSDDTKTWIAKENARMKARASMH